MENMSTEELVSAKEQLEVIGAFVTIAKSMVANPETVSKEVALEMLNGFATLMESFVNASAMIADVELVTREM